MTTPRSFASHLADHFERFIAIKRAGGAKYTTQKRLLLTFDRFLCEQALQPPLESESVLTRFLAARELTPRARDNLVSVVWQALHHARRHGAPVARLPERPPSAPPYWRQRPPRIVSGAEMARLLEAARRLPPRGGWRGLSIGTLLGLLYVTGMRIGEARALNVRDLDPGERILTIESGKFGKSRALPLRRSVVQALTRHIEHPMRPVDAGSSAPIFVSTYRRRISTPTIHAAVQAVGRLAEIAEPLPRPHDFRHTFAVRQLARCYAEDRDFDVVLPALSTYLGHTSTEATRCYLVANGTLFEAAARRFAEATEALDQVSS